MQPISPAPESLFPDKGDYNLLEHFRRHKLEPPSDLYVTLDDIILVKSYAILAATTFNVSLRILTPLGEIMPAFYTFNANAQGVTPTQNRIQNLEGFILSISINQAAGLKGGVYVSMQLQRGVGSGDQTAGQLFLAGYPSAVDALGFPRSSPQSSLDGRALANVLAIGNPLAGADYSITVPAGVNWIVRSFRMQLVTSATVANRTTELRIDDGLGNIFADIPQSAVIAASTTELLTWAPGLTIQAANNIGTAGLPAEMRLAGGWRIRTVTTSIQAADQFSGAALELETFIGQ